VQRTCPCMLPDVDIYLSQRAGDVGRRELSQSGQWLLGCAVNFLKVGP
jgi:cytochrome c biogenesis protein CcdA